MNIEKQKVLFLCTHNSCRSQIAQGMLRALCREKYESYSAGIEKTKLFIHLNCIDINWNAH